MGRLKKDHTGWRTSGLWLKYKHPQAHEPQKHKSKKDTRKWCRGKVGVQHDWHRYQEERYSFFLDDWVPSYVETKCLNCKKRIYKRLSKTSHLPLHLCIKHDYSYDEITVRVVS